MAYFRLEPFGEERMDYRFAMLCALIANIVRGKKGKPLTPKDFMPSFEEPEEKSWEDLLEKVVGINNTLGGEDLRA
jgi:Protein of unknown function (DUF4035)